MTLSCGQINNSQEKNQESDSTREAQIDSENQKPMNDSFPFQIAVIDGGYTITAQIEGDGLYPKYYDFFKKHGYEGNGYCWEGHVIQILEKLDKELISHINFDPEAGTFFAIADNKANQMKFVTILNPVFSDLTKLEEYVKKADRSRIDD